VPTITYCTVTLLTIDPLCCRSSILRLDSFFSCQLLTAVFAGWLTDSLSSLAGSLTDWLTDSTLQNSCLKVGMCGRYSEHLVPRLVSALWRVGYWGNICCVWNVGIRNHVSGNRCIRNHGYNNVSLRRCVAVTIYPAVGQQWQSAYREPVTILYIYVQMYRTISAIISDSLNHTI
jgi:hypothetical protein